MNSENKTARILEDVKVNIKIKLSALWVVLMMLYIYADIFYLYKPGQIETIIAGLLGPFPANQVSLLSASILLAIPAFMIFLSISLKPTLNRWINITFAILYTLVDILNILGEPWAFYIFYGLLETVITLLIIFTAWKWPRQDS